MDVLRRMLQCCGGSAVGLDQDSNSDHSSGHIFTDSSCSDDVSDHTPSQIMNHQSGVRSPLCESCCGSQFGHDKCDHSGSIIITSSKYGKYDQSLSAHDTKTGKIPLRLNLDSVIRQNEGPYSLSTPRAKTPSKASAEEGVIRLVDLTLTPRTLGKLTSPEGNTSYRSLSPRQQNVINRLEIPVDSWLYHNSSEENRRSNGRGLPVPPGLEAQAGRMSREERLRLLTAMFKDFVVELNRGVYLTQLTAEREFVNNIHCSLNDTLDVLTLDQNSGLLVEFPASDIVKTFIKPVTTTVFVPSSYPSHTASDKVGDGMAVGVEVHKYIAVVEFRLRKLLFAFDALVEAQRFQMCMDMLVSKAINSKHLMTAKRLSSARDDTHRGTVLPSTPRLVRHLQRTPVPQINGKHSTRRKPTPDVCGVKNYRSRSRITKRPARPDDSCCADEVNVDTSVLSSPAASSLSGSASLCEEVTLQLAASIRQEM